MNAASSKNGFIGAAAPSQRSAALARAFPWPILVGLILSSYLVLIALAAPFLIQKKVAGDTDMNQQGLVTLFLVSQALTLALIAVVLWRRLRREGLGVADLGVRRFSPWAIPLHTLGFVPAVFVLAVVMAIGSALLGMEPPQDSSREMTRSLGLIPTLILAVGFAPIIEELLFRGVLLTRLATRMPFWVAGLISGVVFALAHANPVQIVMTLPMGFYLAFAYRRTGSIVPGMVIHALWNLMVTLVVR